MEKSTKVIVCVLTLIVLTIVGFYGGMYAYPSHSKSGYYGAGIGAAVALVGSGVFWMSVPEEIQQVSGYYN